MDAKIADLTRDQDVPGTCVAQTAEVATEAVVFYADLIETSIARLLQPAPQQYTQPQRGSRFSQRLDWDV